MELVFNLSVLYLTVLFICSTYYAFNVAKTPLLEESLMEPMVDLSRIVGGKEAMIENYPHQVSFIVNDSYFCGGFIVSDSSIITAAHCAQNVDPSTVVLRAGSSWRKNGTVIPISEVIPHPEYDNPSFDKDVAVMRIAEPINFTDTIKPIKLPPINRILKGRSKVNISGWGRTMQGASSIPEHLMDVETEVVPEYQCRASYLGVKTENMVCVGNFWFGEEGTCQGDSGGTAVQDGMAVGIVSFGRGCGQPLSPSVLAKISSPTIRDFIKEHTGL